MDGPCLLQGYALKAEDGSMYYGRGMILRADKRTRTMAGHAVRADAGDYMLWHGHELRADRMAMSVQWEGACMHCELMGRSCTYYGRVMIHESAR